MPNLCLTVTEEFYSQLVAKAEAANQTLRVYCTLSLGGDVPEGARVHKRTKPPEPPRHRPGRKAKGQPAKGISTTSDTTTREGQRLFDGLTADEVLAEAGILPLGS